MEGIAGYRTLCALKMEVLRIKTEEPDSIMMLRILILPWKMAQNWPSQFHFVALFPFPAYLILTLFLNSLNTLSSFFYYDVHLCCASLWKWSSSPFPYPLSGALSQGEWKSLRETCPQLLNQVRWPYYHLSKYFCLSHTEGALCERGQQGAQYLRQKQKRGNRR